jgi:RNA polymerase sigma-70 factor (ECF subfamily)
MTERTIQVLHVLVPQRCRGETHLLLYPHPRWRDATGRPMLALPTTKLSASPTTPALPIAERLASLLSQDAGWKEFAMPAWALHGDAQASLVSPTHGVRTNYCITSISTHLPVARHGAIARHLAARWLSPAAALGREDLSPTARAVLQTVVDGTSLLPLFQSAPQTFVSSADPFTQRLLAARDGDQEQFGMAVEEARPWLIDRLRRCRWTWSLTLRPEDLADVLADASIRAFEKLELFDPSRGTGLVWLWTITRNLAITRLRRQRRSFPLMPVLAEGLTSREREPIAALMAQEELASMQHRLDRALRTASPRARQAWTLRMQEQRPYREIAARMQVPMSTVATWIARIRRQAQFGGS